MNAYSSTVKRTWESSQEDTARTENTSHECICIQCKNANDYNTDKEAHGCLETGQTRSSQAQESLMEKGVFFPKDGGFVSEHLSSFKSGTETLPTGIVSRSLHSEPAGGALLAAVAGWPCPKAKV